MRQKPGTAKPTAEAMVNYIRRWTSVRPKWAKISLQRAANPASPALSEQCSCRVKADTSRPAGRNGA